MRSLMLRILINTLKLAIAIALVVWMVESGKLDFSQLSIVIERPDVLLASVGMWVVVVVFLACFRWWILLKGIGINPPYFRAMHLHLIGLFFNSTMPGAVGGDIIKAVYIMRDNDQTNKTSAMLTILLDRIVGLIALFFLAAVSTTLHFSYFWEMEVLRPLILFIYSLVGFSIAFYAVVFIPIQDESDPILKFLSLHIIGFKLIKKIYVALRSYRRRPQILIYAFLISVVNHLVVMSYFIFLTSIIVTPAFNYVSYATIYTIGIFVTALPLAPGGLGVGHVAFDQLYNVIGLHHGANIFNIYFLSNIFLNLIGIVPYLFFRRQVSP